jgi:hypothetical protein
MATHDYVIDNQSAPAFRSDLNNALLAIVSQNSASTAPTTTYANMFWYDTATNILKKRNEANSAWINLGTIDEGTGTFTPTGERALASQAQAEAGTDNTTLMTPLRTAQATAQAIDAQVGSAIAGIAAGAVGSALWGTFASTALLTYGTSVAGSSLKAGSVTPGGADSEPGVQAGTWRYLGYQAGGVQRYTGFVRIS